MPNLRKRKSEQLPFSRKETKQGTRRRMSSREGVRELGGDVKETEVINSIDEPTKLPTKSSEASPKDDSTVPEVTVSATEINVLSDEVLIQIFSHLSTKTIAKVVGRICKRWNTLSKDKVLWRFVDIRFARLNPDAVKSIFRQFCHPGQLKSLYMKAESPWYGNKEVDRKSFKQTICLTPGVLKDLTEAGSGLERFGIAYEQIQSKSLLLSALPSQLTHLSLAYCNLDKDSFKLILLPGSECLLKELMVLDLTGVMVFNLSIPKRLKLPPKLHTLKFRNSEISIYDSGIQRLILDQKQKLIELDLSIMPVCYAFLWDISTKLKKLEYLNLCGSVIAMEGHDTVTHFQGVVTFDDWHWMWGEQDGVFESLKAVNLRNLTHVGGALMDDPCFMEASWIDVNGKHILIDDEQDMDPTLLSDVKKKWNEWKRSSLERTKHSFEARRKRDIKRYGFHPEWPANMFQSHPDYDKDEADRLIVTGESGECFHVLPRKATRRTS